MPSLGTLAGLAGAAQGLEEGLAGLRQRIDAARNKKEKRDALIAYRDALLEKGWSKADANAEMYAASQGQIGKYTTSVREQEKLQAETEWKKAQTKNEAEDFLQKSYKRKLDEEFAKPERQAGLEETRAATGASNALAEFRGAEQAKTIAEKAKTEAQTREIEQPRPDSGMKITEMRAAEDEEEMRLYRRLGMIDSATTASGKKADEGPDPDILNDPIEKHPKVISLYWRTFGSMPNKSMMVDQAVEAVAQKRVSETVRRHMDIYPLQPEKTVGKGGGGGGGSAGNAGLPPNDIRDRYIRNTGAAPTTPSGGGSQVTNDEVVQDFKSKGVQATAEGLKQLAQDYPHLDINYIAKQLGVQM